MSTPTEPFPGGLELVPVAAVIPGLKILLISTIFSSSLIPTAVVLFVFSTPALRRGPNFILNFCAIVLGLTQGVVYVYVIIKELALAQPSQTLKWVTNVLSIAGPICVQAILFLRVLAVYPPHQQSVTVRIGMYGPALAMKVARVANACCLIYALQRDTGNIPKTLGAQSAAVWASPFAKSELFLQLVDDVYVSSLFLLKIQVGVKFSGKQLRRNSNKPRITQSSYAARLRMLFWIALSNFVFPVIFNIAQLVLIFRDADYMEGIDVITMNSYISILGVLFSTIWASGTQRMGDTSTVTNSSMRSHSNPYSTSIIAGHLPLVPPKPTHPNPIGSLSVPPELKVRFSSRSDLETTSGETDSSDEHRFIAQPRIEVAIRHHLYPYSYEG